MCGARRAKQARAAALRAGLQEVLQRVGDREQRLAKLHAQARRQPDPCLRRGVGQVWRSQSGRGGAPQEGQVEPAVRNSLLLVTVGHAPTIHVYLSSLPLEAEVGARARRMCATRDEGRISSFPNAASFVDCPSWDRHIHRGGSKHVPESAANFCHLLAKSASVSRSSGVAALFERVSVTENSGVVSAPERYGRPLKGGCPIGKGKEIRGHRDHRSRWPRGLALAEGVGELLGHGGGGSGGGEGENQSDGEENLLHERSPV